MAGVGAYPHIQLVYVKVGHGPKCLLQVLVAPLYLLVLSCLLPIPDSPATFPVQGFHLCFRHCHCLVSPIHVDGTDCELDVNANSPK